MDYHLKKGTKMNWENIFQTVMNWLTTVGIKVIIALILLIVSFKLINCFSKKIEKACEKNTTYNIKYDKTLTRTLSNIFRIVLKVIVCACLVGYLGLDTSGITALIASLGVGFGLAINGTISNFAGGILLLFTRPFKDDDFIEACGYSGTVEDICICNTKIITPDNKVVYLPNGKLSTCEIVNYSEKDLRRVDVSFSIGYSVDFDTAKEIILGICSNNSLILSDPAPMVLISEHASSSIDLITRVWCKNADYWTVHFDLLEQVKKAFDEKGIEIPFPQVDVHMRKD